MRTTLPLKFSRGTSLPVSARLSGGLANGIHLERERARNAAYGVVLGLAPDGTPRRMWRGKDIRTVLRRKAVEAGSGSHLGRMRVRVGITEKNRRGRSRLREGMESRASGGWSDVGGFEGLRERG